MEKILAERKKRYEVEFNFVKATTELTKFNLEKKYPEDKSVSICSIFLYIYLLENQAKSF